MAKSYYVVSWEEKRDENGNDDWHFPLELYYRTYEDAIALVEKFVLNNSDGFCISSSTHEQFLKEKSDLCINIDELTRVTLKFVQFEEGIDRNKVGHTWDNA